MRTHYTRSSLLALSMCLAAMLPTAAFAQESAADDAANDSGREEIIVTAQRRAQSLQKVPVAVSTVTSAALETSGVLTTDQLLEVSPGLSFTRQLSGATPFIRGVGTPSVTAGNEGSVALYVDGVYFISPYANVFSFNNVEQVEVLRGPQGTLYGRNATGGLINVRTKDPQAELTMKASVNYSKYNTIETSAYVSGGSDTIAMDVAVQRTHQGDGYGVNLFNGAEVNYRREWGVRSKIKFTPTDDLKIVLSGDYSHFQSDLGIANFPLPITTPGQGFYDTNANRTPRNDTNWYGGSLSVAYDFGGVTLTSLTAYRKLDVDVDFDQDGSPLRIIDIGLNQNDRSFQQEFLLQGDTGNLNYTAGLFYFDGEGAYNPLEIGSSFIPARNVDLYSPLGVKSYAGFAQGDLELGNTTITLGLRYTSDKRTNTPFFTIPGGDPGNPAQVIAAFPTATKTFNKLTYRFAVAQQFTPDVMAFVSYNRGFKSGVFSTAAPGTAPVEPEVLDAFEVGLRSEFMDRSLRFNVTGFYYDYKNIQLNAIVNGASQIFNAASAKSYGFEVETAYVAHLGDGKLNLSANMSYNKTEYTSFPAGVVFGPAGGAGVATDLSGKELIHAPKLTFNLGADYSVPIGGGMEFSIGGNFFHSAKFFWEPSNRQTQPAVDLLNANAALSFDEGKFRLRIFGKNLLNKQYFSYLVESALGDRASAADPLTYGIGFDVKF